MSVLEVLERDSARRVPGIADGLFRLSEVKGKAWDYSLPTVVKEGNVFLKKRMRGWTIRGFMRDFYQKFPVLAPSWTWDNVLIAGGSVGGIIYGYSRKSDVDIFLYGLNQDEADIRVRDICDHLVQAEKYLRADIRNKNRRKESDKVYTADDFEEAEMDIRYTRTKNCLTVNMADKYIFQIIFRLYQTKSEILHGFDLGSSAIGFDGNDVWLTELGKFSYEYGVNIIDTTRRSTSYESRLWKYFNRGFDIIMPELAVDMLETKWCTEYGLPGACTLPYFVFTYRNRSGNKIVISRSYQRLQGEVSHDYEQTDDNEFALFFLNMTRLIRRKFDEIIYVSRSYRDILDCPQCFTEDRVDYFYGQLEGAILSPKFPSRQAEKYFSIATPQDVFNQRNNRSAIRSLINAQKEEVYKLMREWTAYISKGVGTWLTENPGTQLTGSFNPIIADPREWYGVYYTQVAGLPSSSSAAASSSSASEPKMWV